MAVATTAVFAFIDALLAKVRANATLAADPYNLLVVDGPPLSNLGPPNILFVGASPSDEQGINPDATFSQAWGELGARAKYEDLTVICELWVRTGDTDLSARRATAKAILAAVESDLRTDFTLSIARLMWCTLQAGSLAQIQSRTPPGSVIKLPFTVAAKARLASQ
jgi:hypothetical protein